MQDRIESRQFQSASTPAAAPAPAACVPSRPSVIAVRKSCDADGTGLSHYVLMDRQVKA